MKLLQMQNASNFNLELSERFENFQEKNISFQYASKSVKILKQQENWQKPCKKNRAKKASFSECAMIIIRILHLEF